MDDEYGARLPPEGKLLKLPFGGAIYGGKHVTKNPPGVYITPSGCLVLVAPTGETVALALPTVAMTEMGLTLISIAGELDQRERAEMAAHVSPVAGHA
jgi:hypothetical protein